MCNCTSEIELARPGVTSNSYDAVGVGMVRNARVTCQNN